MVRDEPGLLVASLDQLHAALLLDDGPAALAAFRSYYAAAGAADSTLLASPRATLARILPVWKGANATREEREAVVHALFDARLFTDAVSMTRDPRVPPGPRPSDEAFSNDLALY